MADVVFVRWEDAFSPHGGWKSQDDIKTIAKKQFVIDTVGILLSVDEGGIVLAQGWTVEEEPTYNNVIKIPRPWIHRCNHVGNMSYVKIKTPAFKDVEKAFGIRKAKK